MPHFGARKTRAQRAAINKRAAAAERPISAWQVEALRAMAKRMLARGRAGWASELLPGRYWQAQTIRSLAARGLCSLGAGRAGHERFARITAAGRRELARHSPVGRRHAWGLPR